MAHVSSGMRKIISRIMRYVLFVFLVLVLSLMKTCKGTSESGCRFPVLSNHDDVMNSITAETVDLATSVLPNLYEGWCRLDDEGSYVEVDLRIELSLTGMVIRGHNGRWLKQFRLQYSKDGSSWDYYNENGPKDSPMSLPGNTDAETNNLFWFKFTLEARYIRVIPDPYEGGTHGGGGKPCFRFDLFGCYNDIRNSLGLSEGRVGATLLITSGHARQRSRWNITTIYKGVDSSKGWCPLMNTQSTKEQLIILLEGVHEVSGFAIMKCSNLPCVPVNATFIMRTWSKRDIEERPNEQALRKGGEAIFPIQGAMVGGNSETLLYIFKKPVSGNTIFMDFYPSNCGVADCSFCLRMELYGNQLECLSALGVESSYLHPHGAVKDKQMAASSSHGDHPPHFGRREHKSAWCASPVALKDPVIARSQYLQIDFMKRKIITAISTQGLNSANYVKAYYLYHAMNEVDFHSLRDEGKNTRKLFETCPEFGKRLQFNFLTKPILARYLRINPQRWLNSMCLRVEVFGCDAGASPLGMEFGMVPHQQIEASSETQNNTKNFGRLNNAGWCAVVEPVILGKVQYHYFRVDMLNPHFVCSVASQGIRTSFTEREPEGVTSYYLKYSLTGVEWLRYHKLLAGEYRGNTMVQHWLEPHLVTRFIEFNPQTSHSPSQVCMRVEIYTSENDGEIS
ncbi:uncharacterized protein LOC141864443 isoform X3 [Acropora palmata]|uniref:uncharacterized protein LOC141864443 isoform X3 n=1 Tax=Acropora palmata TaxID=6131 RepID=UPI003DA0CF04